LLETGKVFTGRLDDKVQLSALAIVADKVIVPSAVVTDFGEDVNLVILGLVTLAEAGGASNARKAVTSARPMATAPNRRTEPPRIKCRPAMGVNLLIRRKRER
jgi:hypothetical protein